MEELYKVLSRGVRGYVCKHFGPFDIEDRVHNVYLVVASAIRSGSLREPEALMGFTAAVLKRQVASGISAAARSRLHVADMAAGPWAVDRRPNPEQQAIEAEKKRLMMLFLREISPRDREILTRFYLHDQTPARICQEMDLTETQFRLLKSRAKGRFHELVQQRTEIATQPNGEKQPLRRNKS